MVVRTKNEDPAAVSGVVRGAISSVDPQQPISDVATMQEVLANSAARERFSERRRKSPTMSSEIAIIATATKLVRFETQIRRRASRKK